MKLQNSKAVQQIDQRPETVLTGFVQGFATEGIARSTEVTANLFGFAVADLTRSNLHSENHDAHAEWMLEHLTLRKAGNFLANQVLVDLGAGRSSFGYRIAARFGASAYIANELGLNSYQNLMYALKDALEDESNKIPAFAFAEDMMATLDRIPSNSVSFLISGLDNFILPDRDFVATLAKKVVEKVSPQGAIILVSPHKIIKEVIAATHYLEEIVSLIPESESQQFHVYLSRKCESGTLKLPARK
jgi:hypothetical protein